MKVTFRNSAIKIEHSEYSTLPAASIQTNFNLQVNSPYVQYAEGYALYLYDITGLTSVKVKDAIALVSRNGVILAFGKCDSIPESKTWTSTTGQTAWGQQFNPLTQEASPSYQGVKIDMTPEETFAIDPQYNYNVLMVMAYIPNGAPTVKGK